MHSSTGLSSTLIAVIVILAAAAPERHGVWERIHYGSASQPSDVFFTTLDEGWLAVADSVLHTNDGGAHWDVQLPDSVAKPRGILRELRFIDGIHGWVIARGSANAVLLRTIDGRVWQAVDTTMPPITDYGFVSDSIGVALSGTRILRTTNSGASWAVASECLTVGTGVPVSCMPQRLHFVSPETGYVAAVTRGHTAAAPEQPETRWTLLRTIDAGASWQPLAGDHAGVAEALFFTNADTGYVRVADGYIYATRDAGGSWRPVAPSIGARLRFADPEVGWSLGPSTLTYTINGGATWDTIPSGLSGTVSALSLPRRDRAYAIVGGSLFRYRVTSTDSALDVAATIRAMPPPESTSSAQVKKLAAQVLAQSNSTTPSSRTRNADSLLAEIRLLAVRHRNLNLLVDGTDDARAVLDHVREVQLRVSELHASSGAAAKLHAFTQLTVAIDSLSSVTSLAIERVPKFRIRLRKKRTASAPNHIESEKVAQPQAMVAPAPRTTGHGSKVKVPNDSAAGRNVADTARAKAVAKPTKIMMPKGDSARAKPDSSKRSHSVTKPPNSPQ